MAVSYREVRIQDFNISASMAASNREWNHEWKDSRSVWTQSHVEQQGLCNEGKLPFRTCVSCRLGSRHFGLYLAAHPWWHSLECFFCISKCLVDGSELISFGLKWVTFYRRPFLDTLTFVFGHLQKRHRRKPDQGKNNQCYACQCYACQCYATMQAHDGSTVETSM